MCVNDADGDGVCDELEVIGCQDPTAFNYNALATDAGDCIPVIFDVLIQLSLIIIQMLIQKTEAHLIYTGV